MTDDLRALDAQIAAAFGFPLEPPCPRQHRVDDAEYDADIGWLGWCYTCNESISAVPPEPRRFSTDPAACRLVEDEIARRGLGARYAQRLLALVLGEEWDVTLCDDGGHVTPGVLWLLVRATPAQRCRAALEAVGEGDAKP